MSRRSGGEPNASQSFLQRILHALDMKPDDMAAEFAGDDYRERRQIRRDLHVMLQKPASQLTDIDRDELWAQIEELADKRLAYLLALRMEMQGQLSKQRERRALRLAKLGERPDVPPPRSLPRRTL
jgi:hypothetical protein